MNLIHLVAYSPVIVGFLLIAVCILLRQRYQWALVACFKYVFFGGVIFFVCIFIYIMYLTFLYNLPQGPLSLFWYGPLAFSLGELAGFALFVWLAARKRKRLQEPT